MEIHSAYYPSYVTLANAWSEPRKVPQCEYSLALRSLMSFALSILIPELGKEATRLLNGTLFLNVVLD